MHHTKPVIAHIVQHLQPGGIECMALDFLVAARAAPDSAPNGDRVVLISLDGTGPALVEAWPRLAPYADDLYGLGKRSGLQPGLILNLARLLRRLAVTTVHTHHIGPLLYGGLAARLAGITRIIHTEHDAWHLADPRRRRLEGALLTLVRPTLVADAGLVARALASAFPHRHPRIIYNGIDVDRFHPTDQGAARRGYGLPQDALLIGCAARLEPVKGVDRLLDGFAALPATAIDADGVARPIHLVVAGTGSQAKRLRDQATQLQINDRVTFLGQIDEMPGFYPCLDLFCLASRAEGLPLSLLEAQACAVPVVATDVGGMRDAVCPVTGTLVPPDDPILLAGGLLATLTRRILGDGGAPCSPRRFVVDDRNLNVMIRAYHQLYAA